MTNDKETKKVASAESSSVQKTAIAHQEEETLRFWNEKHVFEASLEKTKNGKPFVFYDGPPFATGLPHYGHILAGTIKDAIPRYQTMKGRYVRRQWGWDCHGLPIENLIEDKLGFKNKQDIEDYGVENFNTEACNSVLTYDKEWKEIVPRMGRFVDMEQSYKTMDWTYSESIWWAFKTLYDKKYIYKGYKSMHICPRCETTLSNNEVADGYKDIKDISITAKFELTEEGSAQGGHAKTFILAWTTTPWTLPGNVALAVGKKVKYAEIDIEGKEGKYILAKDLLEKVVKEKYTLVKEIKGSDLIGKSYKPLFDYYAKDTTLENHANGWKIYDADFVTTEDGTGVVHIAPAFGEDDMNLGKEKNLPFVQHVKMNGTMKPEVTDFAGLVVKPKDDKTTGADHMSTDIVILKHLTEKGLVFSKEKYEHSYPHCWRCKTPLLNYAANSWFVKVTEIKKKMVKENETINWVPESIGRARFGNWIADARDWAISRTRYWGAPFPVWQCDTCEKQFVAGSIKDIQDKVLRKNTYILIRHGEAENNVKNVISSKKDTPHHLTKKGREQVEQAAEVLKKEKIDLIIASPFVRTKETAKILSEKLDVAMMFDERLSEPNFGDFEGRPNEEYHAWFSSLEERFEKRCPGGENLSEVKRRVGEFLYELETKHANKKILIVSHDYAIWLMQAVSEGYTVSETVSLRSKAYLDNAGVRALPFLSRPHNREYETDLHRPYIDEFVFPCTCGKEGERGVMKRVSDVFDCWFESGSMPYAQFHYPFENKEVFEQNFPADFIAEGLDQTRGWFYTLLVLAVGIFDTTPYKNVIVNGMALAEDGQKMSKSLKNYPDPMDVVHTYGADALRYNLLSSPIVRAETLNFSEKGVGEVYRKVVVRLLNVLSFYEMYADRKEKDVEAKESPNVLDQWILACLFETHKKVSDGFDTYQLDKATRPIGDFVDDLSTWYLRRSRSRFKDDDAQDRDYALATTRYVLEEFSKIIAPVTPFVAEYVYGRVAVGKEESVHLAKWPEMQKPNEKVLADMSEVRKTVSFALEARAKEGIKVRQPLASMALKSGALKDKNDLLNIIMDEVNVKGVTFSVKASDSIAVADVLLDTKLTPELIEEGKFRELVRNIQELRKETGLTPDDSVTATIETDEKGKDLVTMFKSELMKTTLLKEVVFGDVSEGKGIIVDDLKFKVVLEK